MAFDDQKIKLRGEYSLDAHLFLSFKDHHKSG